MHDRSAPMAMQALLDAGLAKQAIAAHLGVSRRTLTRWQSATEATSRKPRVHQLDAYKAIIRTHLETYPTLTAQRLFEAEPVRFYVYEQFPTTEVMGMF